MLEGRWQDWFSDEKMGQVLELAGEGFDAIFIDTFAEGYEGEVRGLRSLLLLILSRLESVLRVLAGYTGTRAWCFLVLERSWSH